MNKVLFICLVSLSICFSSPTGKEEKSPSVAPPAVLAGTPTIAPNTQDVKDTSTEHATEQAKQPSPVAAGETKVPSAHENAAPAHENVAPAHENVAPAHENVAPAHKTETDASQPKTEASPAKTDANPPKTEVTPAVDNKTDNKIVKPESSTGKVSSTAAPVKPDDNKKDAVTTEHSVTTSKPTSTPKADEKPEVVLQSRAFDGPSFVGGIILTLGMLAVGFIGFKYYKSQTERNYHTL